MAADGNDLPVPLIQLYYRGMLHGREVSDVHWFPFSLWHRVAGGTFSLPFCTGADMRIPRCNAKKRD
jgi:hypothetical protein